MLYIDKHGRMKEVDPELKKFLSDISDVSCGRNVMSLYEWRFTNRDKSQRIARQLSSFGYDVEWEVRSNFFWVSVRLGNDDRKIPSK